MDMQKIKKVADTLLAYISDYTEAQDVYSVLEELYTLIDKGSDAREIVSRVLETIEDTCHENSICPRCGAPLTVTGDKYPEINTFENVYYHCHDCGYEKGEN